MGTHRDIMGEILSADDEELREGNEALDYLIHQGVKPSPAADHPPGDDVESTWKISRHGLSVVVYEEQAKIRMRVALHGQGRRLALKEVAGIAAKAILRHLQQEETK